MIKNCPFCGSVAHFLVDGFASYAVRCENYGCRAKIADTLPYHYSEENVDNNDEFEVELLKAKLVEKWNKRTAK